MAKSALLERPLLTGTGFKQNLNSCQSCRLPVPGRSGDYSPLPPRIRTCGIITYGSSVHNRTKINYQRLLNSDLRRTERIT